MKIIDKIKTYLEASGMTQDQLAKAAGVHPVTLSNLLNQKTSQESAFFKLDRYIEDHPTKEAESAVEES